MLKTFLTGRQNGFWAGTRGAPTWNGVLSFCRYNLKQGGRGRVFFCGGDFSLDKIGLVR